MNYFVCFFIGWLYTLSFSPYNISLLSLLSILILLLLLDLDSLKDTTIKAFLFSSGYFLSGTYWLENVIRQYSEVGYILSIIIILFFILYLSIFIALPIIISSYLKINLKLHKNYSLIIMSILITFFEIIRAEIFTGYSWHNFGQSGIGAPLEYFFPVIGVHGITLIIFLSALIIANIIRSKNLKFFLPLLTIFLLFYFSIYSKEWTFESSKTASITIIQPNITNKLSYDKEEIIKRMNTLSNMSSDLAVNSPDIILWPEAPLTVPYNNIKKSYYENILRNLPSSTSLVTGSFYEDNGSIYNTIINVSDPSNLYHKKHLVPFGEYLPFRKTMSSIYNFIGINIYDLSKGKISNVIKINEFKAYSLICYESIFSKESLIKIPEVDFILNVSNDGWFGDSLAPYQHLDALRMRALENQRYAIRSANNGISAIISPNGNIVNFIPYNKMGLINASIKARNGYTPLSKYGYKTLYIFIFLIFIYASIYFNLKVFKRF